MGLFSRKTYIVHSPETYGLALTYEAGIRELCYIPGRDSRSETDEKQQRENWWAMLFSKKTVVIIWDNSTDACFWLGVAFSMRKKWELIPADMFSTDKRKFDA